MRSSLLAKFTDLPQGGSSQTAATAAAAAAAAGAGAGGGGYADMSRCHPAVLGSTPFILFCIHGIMIKHRIYLQLFQQNVLTTKFFFMLL